MENNNYSYNSSYPDSRDSSPRSREIDLDHHSWDDQQSTNSNFNPNLNNYKVKLMCSYGGKIQPRPHDHQLSYVGGDTKILSVDRSINLSSFLAKLSSISDSSTDRLCFKYQLPGEDLDALISVTNDDDLDHLMLEYDRLAKPARLRLFLFPLDQPSSHSQSQSQSQSQSPASFDPKSERQWFLDALNSVHIEGAAPARDSNPDFLFGFDKKMQLGEASPPVQKNVAPGMSTHEQACQAMFNRTEAAREKIAPLPAPVPMQAPYEQPVYFIPSVYQQGPPGAMRTGQAYYGMQRMAVSGPEVYREQQSVYNAMQPLPLPLHQQQQQQKFGVYGEPVGMVQQQQQQKMGVPEQGYTQVGYDSSGRQVYYTTSTPGGGMVLPQQFQAGVAGVDGRQGGGGGGAGGATMNQEGKVVVKTPQSPV